MHRILISIIMVIMEKIGKRDNEYFPIINYIYIDKDTDTLSHVCL